MILRRGPPGRYMAGTYYACDRSGGFARIAEDGISAKADNFDDVFRGHDAAFKFEVAMCEPYFMKIFDTVTNLAGDAVNL